MKTIILFIFILQIVYSVIGFLDKNMDTLPLGVKNSLEDSNNELVSLLFRGIKEKE